MPHVQGTGSMGHKLGSASVLAKSSWKGETWEA